MNQVASSGHFGIWNSLNFLCWELRQVGCYDIAKFRFVSTVKLDFKELLNKEQIDFKELFTDYQLFYTINLLLNKELLPI